ERVMLELQELLRKHHLPLAHHTCLERDNAVPGALLIQILLQLLDAFPGDSLVSRLAALLTQYPWLPVRFPELGAKGAVTRPGDITEFIAGLRDLLLAFTRMLPCIAIIDGLQFADAPSMNELVEMQNRTDHTLRLIASIEPQEYPLPAKLRTLMHTEPLIIRLPLYTREEVRDYLHNFSATLATEEVVDALYLESNGAPLVMEETLRRWLDEGKLLFQQNLWSARLAEPAKQLIPIFADRATEDEGKLTQVTADLLTPEELDQRIKTMLALRILGLHLRLYPDNSSLVVNALQDVQRFLNELPDYHASITVSFDGAEILVDRHPLPRRELQLPLKDYRNWFQRSMLGELQIERGISDTELILFLRTLATYDETKADRPLVEILRGLALPHVHYKTLQEVSTPKTVVPAESEARVNQLLIILGHMLASEAAPDNPLVKKLLAELSVASIMHRRAMMEALLRELHARKQLPIPATLHHICLQSLASQDDPVVLADVLVIMEQVFTWLLQQQHWDEAALLLEAIRDRLQHEADETIQHALTAFLVAAGNPTTLAPLLYYRSDKEELPDAIRRIYILLGQKALASLEYAIKNTDKLTEYPHMVTALRLYRKEERDQLAQALREPGNRMTIINLLNVLAAAGSTATLGAIEEKLPHPDPGVRIAALNATVNIAGAGAVGVVVNALADKDTAVRARAVVLAGMHPQEGVRDALVKLSHHETDEDVLETLCQTLGIFKDSHARDALLHLFQTTRYSDRIRVAACQVLAIFRSELVVHTALRSAAAENSPRISIAARGVLRGE
ncbi:MAG: HEAT repeat domain-containing protein, partial [bacterium]